MDKQEILEKLQADRERADDEAEERAWARSPERLVELSEEFAVHGASADWRRRWNAALAATADDEPLPEPPAKAPPQPPRAVKAQPPPPPEPPPTPLSEQYANALTVQMRELTRVVEKLRHSINRPDRDTPGIIRKDIPTRRSAGLPIVRRVIK